MRGAEPRSRGTEGRTGPRSIEGSFSRAPEGTTRAAPPGAAPRVGPPTAADGRLWRCVRVRGLAKNTCGQGPWGVVNICEKSGKNKGEKKKARFCGSRRDAFQLLETLLAAPLPTRLGDPAGCVPVPGREMLGAPLRAPSVLSSPGGPSPGWGLQPRAVPSAAPAVPDVQRAPRAGSGGHAAELTRGHGGCLKDGSFSSLSRLFPGCRARTRSPRGKPRPVAPRSTAGVEQGGPTRGCPWAPSGNIGQSSGVGCFYGFVIMPLILSRGVPFWFSSF